MAAGVSAVLTLDFLGQGGHGLLQGQAKELSEGKGDDLHGGVVKVDHAVLQIQDQDAVFELLENDTVSDGDDLHLRNRTIQAGEPR